VALTDWPTKVLPEAYFNEENPLIVPGEAPRVALRTIEKYDAFMGVKVSEPGRDAGVLSQLSAGQSAVALRVDVASGVSGFLRPGDHVDVYWTGRLNSEISGQTGEVTRRVLSKVRVIGIDQSSAVEYGAAIVARTVTVAGNAEEVAKLQYAQQTGKLSLSLLARDAISETDVVEIDQRALLGLQDTVAAPVEAPKQKTCVTVERRGTERIEISRPCS
jgi:pilus assembly protein CpaB